MLSPRSCTSWHVTSRLCHHSKCVTTACHMLSVKSMDKWAKVQLLVINFVYLPGLRDLQVASKTFPGMLVRKGSAFELEDSLEDGPHQRGWTSMSWQSKEGRERANLLSELGVYPLPSLKQPSLLSYRSSCSRKRFRVWVLLLQCSTHLNYSVSVECKGQAAWPVQGQTRDIVSRWRMRH